MAPAEIGGPSSSMIVDANTSAFQVQKFIDDNRGNVKAEKFTGNDGQEKFKLWSVNEGPGLWSKIKHMLGIQTRRSLTNEAFAKAIDNTFGGIFTERYLDTVTADVASWSPISDGSAGKFLDDLHGMSEGQYGALRPGFQPRFAYQIIQQEKQAANQPVSSAPRPPDEPQIIYGIVTQPTQAPNQPVPSEPAPPYQPQFNPGYSPVQPQHIGGGTQIKPESASQNTQSNNLSSDDGYIMARAMLSFVEFAFNIADEATR